MRLSVATNFQPELVDGLAGKPVLELYGKLRQDAVGGGRAPYQLAPVSRAQVAEHVRHAASRGIGFNYLLNGACLGNREITRAGQRELDELLGWVTSIGVRSVTVASPFVLTLVKRRFPDVKVRVSVFAGVDRVRKAQMWEELGADCIVLDSLLVNRELATLRSIRKHVRCDLELLANNSCLQSCALSPMHMGAMSHAAQAHDRNGGFFIDWCFLRCTRAKLERKIDLIRSEWIRPEDLHLYEGLGYDRFKLVERDLPTAVMLRRVDAYAARRYDGNLLDLVQPYGFKDAPDDDRYYKRGWWARLRFLLQHVLRPGLANPTRMLLLKRLADLRGMTTPLEGDAPVVVDNRALDGFMERFQKQGCRERDCDECGWCGRWAEAAVRVDPERKARAMEAYDEVFEALEGGGMWRWSGGGGSPAPAACPSGGAAGCGGCGGS